MNINEEYAYAVGMTCVKKEVAVELQKIKDFNEIAMFVYILDEKGNIESITPAIYARENEERIKSDIKAMMKVEKQFVPAFPVNSVVQFLLDSGRVKELQIMVTGNEYSFSYIHVKAGKKVTKKTDSYGSLMQFFVKSYFVVGNE